MKFRQATLDNGLDIVAEVNPNAYSLATAFFVKTGSRDESSEVAGVSHFLEHMVFKGTARRTAEDVNRELDELGAQSNAFTSEEQTVYYAVVLPELQSQIVDLLADIMRPTLRQEDFDTEKKVILEEIMKYDDQPPYGGHEKSMAAWFGKHPLGNSVLGTQQSVGDLSQQQMMAYFQQRYSPTNMTLVATGNVDFDKLVDQANELCGSWKKYDVTRNTVRPVGLSNFQLITKETSIQQYVIQLAESPGSEDEARYAARLLATIMGDDVGSRFFWELVDPGLAEFAAMESYEFQGCGVMMNYVCCAPQDAQRVLEVVNHEVEKLMTDGITQRELDLAKNKVCSHVVLRSERPSSRLFSVGSSWTQRKSLRTVKETVDSYQKVQLEDIGRLLEKYDLRKTSTTAVGPLTTLHLPQLDQALPREPAFVRMPPKALLALPAVRRQRILEPVEVGTSYPTGASNVTKRIYLTAAFVLLGLVVAPLPAEAGWNALMRYCGEFWSDGYHSKGDPWNKPTKHARELSSYQPYYPVYEAPVHAMPAMEEQVPTPAQHKVTAVSSEAPIIILPKSR